LPRVLSKNDELFKKAYQNPDEASQILQSIRNTSQADFVFILRPDGTTIASSNWQDSENSFVGKNYGFRPYFTEALEQGSGTFFGIGATTSIPGYFVSSKYPETGPVTAVTVVKVNSSSLDKNWKSDEESVFVADKNGVIVLSSNTRWRYKTLKPLSDAQRLEIKKQQQFGNEPLSLLVRKPSLDNESLMEIQGVRYLETTAEVGKMGWTIHYLAPYSVVQSQLVSFWSKAIILALIALAALLIIRTSNTRNALRVSQGESTKLRELNQSLLGQPLSAMRTYMASMEQSRSPEAQQKTLGKLTLLVDRMSSITQQLRYFARSGDKEIRRINLLDTIEGALNMTQPAIQGGAVTLDIQQPNEPVYVIAGSVRMEQVLVNLIRNGLDAMQNNDENSPRHLLIALKQTKEHAILTVEDTGSGLSEESIKMLYEPFYSTKPSGIGMGLGLAISTNIIAELGGTILGENREAGGARFVVTLNRQKSA